MGLSQRESSGTHSSGGQSFGPVAGAVGLCLCPFPTALSTCSLPLTLSFARESLFLSMNSPLYAHSEAVRVNPLTFAFDLPQWRARHIPRRFPFIYLGPTVRIRIHFTVCSMPITRTCQSVILWRRHLAHRPSLFMSLLCLWHRKVISQVKARYPTV